MSQLDDQMKINEELLKAVKDLMGSMEQATRCMKMLLDRIRKLEEQVFRGGGNGKH